ncbi:hypothetical protein SDJN02_16120, partial [Cucurbita argyrosperma subsp. argyrosperma]
MLMHVIFHNSPTKVSVMDNPGKPKKKERQKQKGSGDCNEVEYLDSYGTLLSLCTYSFKSELY